MIEYIAVGIVMLVIFATIYHYNKGKGSPPKSCDNCRFYIGNLCHSKEVMSKFMSHSPVEIEQLQEACAWYDWNGEREGQ